MNSSETQATIFASQLLNVATQKVSSSFDTFSGWLVTGFGAALALFIANLDTISKFASLASVKSASLYFLASAILAVIDKLLASFVAAGTTAVIEGAALGKDLAERDVEIDIARLFSETEKALFWPGNKLARRAFKKAQSDDFAGPAAYTPRLHNYKP